MQLHPDQIVLKMKSVNVMWINEHLNKLEHLQKLQLLSFQGVIVPP